MAGAVQRYVNTASSGGDGTTNNTSGGTAAYASLSAWDAAENTDITAATGSNVIHTVNVDGSGGPDTTFFDLDGWTTAADTYIVIQAVGSQRTNGVSYDNDSTGYQIDGGADEAVRNRENYVRFIGFEMKGDLGSASVWRQTASGTSDVRLNNCLIVSDSAGSDTWIVDALGTLSSLTVTMTNCLVVGKGRGIDTRSTSAWSLDHCGFHGDRDLGIVGEGELTIDNTWAGGYSSEDFWTGGAAHAGGTNNASLDNSSNTDHSTGNVDIVALANEFTTVSLVSSTFDFTLKDSLLNGAGSGALATDIAGTSYPSPSDIGPFAFPVAGGLSIPVAMHQYIRRHSA